MILIMLSNYVLEPTTFSPQDVINLETLNTISWNRGQVFNNVPNYIALYCSTLHCNIVKCTAVYCTLVYCAALFCAAQIHVMLICPQSSLRLRLGQWLLVRSCLAKGTKLNGKRSAFYKLEFLCLVQIKPVN